MCAAATITIRNYHNTTRASARVDRIRQARMDDVDDVSLGETKTEPVSSNAATGL
jgi:hypothetical protein